MKQKRIKKHFSLIDDSLHFLVLTVLLMNVPMDTS